MIGVLSKPHERETVQEFFQLFKTPWEVYDPARRHYDVLVVTGNTIPETDASLIVVYGADKCSLDESEKIGAGIQDPGGFVQWGDVRIPIYGKTLAFPGAARPILSGGHSGHPAGCETYRGRQRILRIGYDLFQEILFLLTTGQPPLNAPIPALDLHIAMLRNWIVETGIPLAEIPPVPAGHRFIACLTHDVDFIGIRRHFLDHSMWGFLYRATIGSLDDAIRRKGAWPKLLENLKAVLSLPFVFLGVCRDPWDQFDRCREIESGVHSTFFLMPFRDRAGQGFDKGQAKRRATRYDITDAGDIIRKLTAQGCEIGVHGIDAWHSVEHGRQELQRIREATGQARVGIRMHWLCRNETTFRILDQAGYSYDSTFGYNEAVGFRAGTAQPYRPPGADSLLEIPLHIQDTALFARGRMNASEEHAGELCRQVIGHAGQSGGALTILWHQRSLGPERLWGGFYEGLVKKLRAENAWFATAGEVADWFNMRRSARFEEDKTNTGKIRVTFEPAAGGALPNLALRQFKAITPEAAEGSPNPMRLEYDDVVLLESQS